MTRSPIELFWTAKNKPNKVLETVNVEPGKIDWKVEMLGLERDLRQSGKGQNRATDSQEHEGAPIYWSRAPIYWSP